MKASGQVFQAPVDLVQASGDDAGGHNAVEWVHMTVDTAVLDTAET